MWSKRELAAFESWRRQYKLNARFVISTIFSHFLSFCSFVFSIHTNCHVAMSHKRKFSYDNLARYHENHESLANIKEIRKITNIGKIMRIPRIISKFIFKCALERFFTLTFPALCSHIFWLEFITNCEKIKNWIYWVKTMCKILIFSEYF